MPKNTYQFYLRKNETTYYKVYGGTVTTSPTPELLDEIMTDWRTLEFLWTRHKVYHGVFRRYAPETVRFVLDGAKILRYVFNTQGGSEADCQLEVRILNTTTQLYVPYAVFDIDFSRRTNSVLYVDVAIMEGGLSKELNAFDSVDYALPLTDPILGQGTEYLLMQGILLKGKYTWVSVDIEPIRLGVYLGGWSLSQYRTLPITYLNQEGPAGIGVPNSNYGTNIIYPGGDFDSTYQFKSLLDVPGLINFKLPVHILNPSSTSTTRLEVELRIQGPKPGVADLLPATTIASTAPIPPLGTLDTDIIGNMIAVIGAYNFTNENYIILQFKSVQISGSGVDNALEVTAQKGGTLTFDYSYTQPDTVIRAMKYWQVFKQLTARMTGNAGIAQSSLLTTNVYPDDTVNNLNPFNLFVTCGDSLRGLPSVEGIGLGDDEAAIKTKFQDFVKDAQLTMCAGIGIERVGGIDKLVLEHMSHFYQKNVLIADLGSEISDWEMTDYNDYKGINIKAGYKDNSYDEVNGRYEFNAQYSYHTAIKRSQNDLDYTMPYRSDCYGADIMRANLAKKETTDSGSDNDTFKLVCNGNTVAVEGYYPFPNQLDKAHTVTQGLPADIAPTVFNMPLTAGRCLRRYLPYLKSNYNDVTAPKLIFETQTKNAAIIASMYGGAAIVESSDISLVSVDYEGSDLLFRPFVFSFKAPVPKDFAERMALMPYGAIRHTLIRDGKRYVLEGFVLEAGINPGERNAYNFKLLCSPKTKLADLMAGNLL